MNLIRSFDRTEIRRPRFYWSFEPGVSFVEVAWDSGYSDPVWRLGVEFTLPAWVHRWLDRRWQRRHRDDRQ